MIGESLEELGVTEVQWLLDRPVSNSGRLGSRIDDQAARRNWNWHVKLVFNPDSEIRSSDAIAVTSDSSILDEVKRWTDLKAHLLAAEIPQAWIIDLSAD
jgi:hypothetical protein